MSLARIDLEERQLDLFVKKAKYLCKVPGLKREIAGNPDAIVGIELGLYGYGLPATISNINNCYDWIQGRATESALFYQQLARLHGYVIIPTIRTADLAVATVTGKDLDDPIQVEFTLDDAIRSHRLDAWVELVSEQRDSEGRIQRWKDGNAKSETETFVVRINGQPRTWQGDIQVDLPDPLPEWVAEKIAAGAVKVYTSWWDYRTDMMWKAAAKRAVRLACPHVLLGGGDFEFAAPVEFSTSADTGSSTAPGWDARPRDFIDVEEAPTAIPQQAEPRGERVPDHVYDNAPEARAPAQPRRSSAPKPPPAEDPERPF
jgi:hypothetical protein